MHIAETLRYLTPGHLALRPGIPQHHSPHDISRLGWTDVAAAMAGLPPCISLFLAHKYALQLDTAARLIDYCEQLIGEIAVRDGWRGQHEHVHPRLARLALADACSHHVCPACGGTGMAADVSVCATCDGSGRKRPPERIIAIVLGVSRGRAHEIWVSRLTSVVRELARWESLGIDHVRKRL